MSDFRFPEELTPGFRVKVGSTGNAWSVQCAGTLDVRDAAGVIQPHFLRLHEALVAASASSVRLDIHAVEYINSSGIKGFIGWFMKAERTVPPPYQIELIYDKDRTWQVVSFAALQRLASKVLVARPYSG